MLIKFAKVLKDNHDEKKLIYNEKANCFGKAISYFKSDLFVVKMANKQIDVDDLFIDYVDSKVFHLKTQVKLKKQEINARFQDIIKTMLEQQNKILEEIDTIFDEIQTYATEQKLKIVRLSERKAKFQNSTNLFDETRNKQIQLEIQEIKKGTKFIPEISVNWNIEGLTKQLELFCEIKTKEHPYTYMENIKYEIHQSETAVQCAPKTFEIDWPTGDVYFLINYEDRTNFSFNIIGFDRFGKQKMVENGNWRCSFERKFCPIGLCLSENHIFVSASGNSANKQIDAMPKEMRSNPMKHEECILKIKKSSGAIEHLLPLKEIESIGPILFEPQEKMLFVLDHKKSSLNIFNLELEPIRNLQLPKRKANFFFTSAGWVSPKIEKVELVNDNFFIFYDQPPHIDICNLNGQTRQLFDTILEISTIDPSQNILTIEKKSNLLQIWDTTGKELTRISNKLAVVNMVFRPIGLKFDILSGRLLYCGFSKSNTEATKNKIALVYL